MVVCHPIKNSEILAFNFGLGIVTCKFWSRSKYWFRSITSSDAFLR
jgi:hypothetical protein